MSRKLSLITLLSLFFMTCFSQSSDYRFDPSDPGDGMVSSDKSLNEHSPSGLIPLYDSITYYKYSLTNGALYMHSMDRNFVYDAHGNKLSSENFWYFEQQWHLENASYFSYNANHKLTRNTKVRPYMNDTIYDLVYDYDNNGNRTLSVRWEELQNEFCIINRETSIYDNNNNVLERVIETRAYGDTLKFVSKELNSYQDNKLDVKFVHKWLNGTWTDDKKNTYSYNVDGKLSEMLNFKIESGNWTENYKYLYAYDNAGNLASRTNMTISTGVWLNISRWRYTYIADKKVTEYYEIWEDSEWLICYDFRYQYDDNLNMVQKESYELVNGEYLLYDYISQAFDVDNIMTNSARFIFSTNGLPQTIVLGDSAVYHFKKVVGVGKMDIPPAHLSIFPNPTSGVVTIDSSTPILSTEVHNLSGEHILTVPGKVKYIDLSSNPAGVYLMKVITHNDVFVRKVVVK